jgi:hypothetical protein
MAANESIAPDQNSKSKNVWGTKTTVRPPLTGVRWHGGAKLHGLNRLHGYIGKTKGKDVEGEVMEGDEAVWRRLKAV